MYQIGIFGSNLLIETHLSLIYSIRNKFCSNSTSGTLIPIEMTRAYFDVLSQQLFNYRTRKIARNARKNVGLWAEVRTPEETAGESTPKQQSLLTFKVQNYFDIMTVAYSNKAHKILHKTCTNVAFVFSTLPLIYSRYPGCNFGLKYGHF
jgi:hypothetical protein